MTRDAIATPWLAASVAAVGDDATASLLDAVPRAFLSPAEQAWRRTYARARLAACREAVAMASLRGRLDYVACSLADAARVGVEDLADALQA